MTRYNSFLSQHLRNFNKAVEPKEVLMSAIFSKCHNLKKIFSYSLVHVTEAFFSRKKKKKDSQDNAALKFCHGVQVMKYLYLLISVLSRDGENYNGKVASECL